MTWRDASEDGEPGQTPGIRPSIQFDAGEATRLRSQFVISNRQLGRGARYLPYAFTEQGVGMLSSVLRSPRAIRVNIEIMRAFVRLRRLMATPGELVEQVARPAETVKVHDERIEAIAEVLRRLMEPPPGPRRRIGFPIPGGHMEE